MNHSGRRTLTFLPTMFFSKDALLNYVSKQLRRVLNPDERIGICMAVSVLRQKAMNDISYLNGAKPLYVAVDHPFCILEMQYDMQDVEQFFNLDPASLDNLRNIPLAELDITRSKSLLERRIEAFQQGHSDTPQETDTETAIRDIQTGKK